VYLAQAGTAGFALIRSVDWPILVALGIGPMGAAFFLWDAALKRGDPRTIGSLSYVTPLLSTLALTLAGGRSLGLLTGAAMVLIIAGAVTGSLRAGNTRQ
jgi:drug/metabolite transporter (DMT)-like permease